MLQQDGRHSSLINNNNWPQSNCLLPLPVHEHRTDTLKTAAAGHPSHHWHEPLEDKCARPEKIILHAHRCALNASSLIFQRGVSTDQKFQTAAPFFFSRISRFFSHYRHLAKPNKRGKSHRSELHWELNAVWKRCGHKVHTEKQERRKGEEKKKKKPRRRVAGSLQTVCGSTTPGAREI